MKNWEKYEEAIKRVTANRLAITNDGKITDCLYIECEDCKFADVYCNQAITEWLYEEDDYEYIE